MCGTLLTLLGLASLPLAFAIYQAFSSQMLPCPTTIQPHPQVNIDKMLGPWHLSLLVVDATEEDFLESAVCVTGELQRHNKSVVRQTWTMFTKDGINEDEPVAMIELPTSVERPGLWSVLTPLGGELKATVFEADPEVYMLVTHCGWHHGALVHLWTAAITRSRVLSPKLRYYLTSALEEHGFHPFHSKIVSWQGC